MTHAAVAVQELELDLPALASAFGRRLHEAGVPVTPDRSARFAQALALTRPVARRAAVLDGPRRARVRRRPGEGVRRRLRRGVRLAARPGRRGRAGAGTEAAPPDDRAPGRGRPGAAGAPGGGAAPSGEGQAELRDVVVPVAGQRRGAPARQALRRARARRARPPVRADDPAEDPTPKRRTRRAERNRHGERIDLRRTLRDSLRTGGDPVRLARRSRRVVPAGSCCCATSAGSMEPYARAYLQFLTCAAGAGPNAEAFVFATRLTRITRALASRSPERAIQRAAAAAPDWSSGTRIGEALRAFNDRHGRRGMARGAVIVILSDGWERGEPELVGREMQRLSRLAYRIVWVNPRVSARASSRAPAGWPPRCRTRRARLRPQPRGARRGRRRDRGRAGARAAGDPRRARETSRGAAPHRCRQLGRDAERLRPEPRKDDARMGPPIERRSASTPAATARPRRRTRWADRSPRSATARTTTR